MTLECGWGYIGLYPSIHQIKGWNISSLRWSSRLQAVSIHQSIKSRVETFECFFYFFFLVFVSIHQSIKSRVETRGACGRWRRSSLSLSINPSNQGLKLAKWTGAAIDKSKSLSINPSNQGLKLVNRGKLWVLVCGSLSINPSNQGLKHNVVFDGSNLCAVSIHQSIKSRVETQDSSGLWSGISCLYPSIHQIKGWNDTAGQVAVNSLKCLYPSIHQIKGWNRVTGKAGKWKSPSLYPSIHQIKGWNSTLNHISNNQYLSLSINPSNQGLKLLN